MASSSIGRLRVSLFALLSLLVGQVEVSPQVFNNSRLGIRLHVGLSEEIIHSFLERHWRLADYPIAFDKAHSGVVVAGVEELMKVILGGQSEAEF